MTSTTTSIDRPSYSHSSLKTNKILMAGKIEDLNSDAAHGICISCSAPLSWGQWLQIYGGEPQSCHSCGGYLTEGRCSDLTVAEADELRAPGYFDREWFHVSEHRNWAEHVRTAKKGELLVHAGSELSALARADHLRRFTPSWRPIEIYLHRFRLSDSTGFSSSILDDMGDFWQTKLSEPLAMGLAPIEGNTPELGGKSLSPSVPGIGYYNRYEVPGDISILFHAQLIDLRSVRTQHLGSAPEVRRITISRPQGGE